MKSRVQSSIGESSFHGNGQNIPPIGQGGDERYHQPPIPVSNPNGMPQGFQQVSPEQINAMRRNFHQQNQGVDSSALQAAKRRVEIITGIGRRTKEVTIQKPDGSGEVTFALRTLKGYENDKLAQVMENAKQIRSSQGKLIFTPTSLGDVKTEALTHSLYLIDNQPIEIVLGIVDYSLEEQEAQRKNLIREMDNILTSHLYREFQELTAETIDGYMPKSKKEAEEVVSEINKSS